MLNSRFHKRLLVWMAVGLCVVVNSCSQDNTEDESDSKVVIALQNDTDTTLYDVELSFGQESSYYGALQSNELSMGHSFKNAYRYGYVTARVDETQVQGPTPIDYVGESILTPGQYKMVIESIDDDVLTVGNAMAADTSIKVAKDASCVRAGCSGQLCVDSLQGDVASNCEYHPSYACYSQATCEIQSDGHCAFTDNEQLQNCLAESSD